MLWVLLVMLWASTTGKLLLVSALLLAFGAIWSAANKSTPIGAASAPRAYAVLGAGIGGLGLTLATDWGLAAVSPETAPGPPVVAAFAVGTLVGAWVGFAKGRRHADHYGVR